MATESKVPRVEHLLSGRGPNVTVSKIDFATTSIPEYKNCYAVILDDVLSATECSDLIAAAEATHGPWEQALVNVGGGRQKLITDVRSCGRIIWDSKEIVDKLWSRCAPHLQDILTLEDKPHIMGAGPIKRKETWKCTRLNERMRFLKYVGGEYFRPHCDGTYETPDRTERSYFTLHLYLNDKLVNPEEPLEGGATIFHDYGEIERLDVEPKQGRVLVFQHRNLLHSGDDVVQGVKYTMRTDIMYAKAEKE